MAKSKHNNCDNITSSGLAKHDYSGMSSWLSNTSSKFSSEVVMEYVLLSLFKSSFLDVPFTSSLTECNPLFHHLHVSMHRLEAMDFSSIA
eukprot:15355786-Ditylum_brightwellii.AAC.1